MQTPYSPRKAGMSLTELMCVIAILMILASLYLPTICRAFLRVKKFLDGF
jgi:prepilin-type N-terminal cleavage/methylation domain-containing protein